VRILFKRASEGKQEESRAMSYEGKAKGNEEANRCKTSMREIVHSGPTKRNQENSARRNREASFQIFTRKGTKSSYFSQHERN
jgi:hypothetical protein